MDDILAERQQSLAELDSWEEFVGAGIYAVTVRSAMQMVIGYLASRVQTQYGEDRVGKFAYELGLAGRTVRDWRTIYKFWYLQNSADAPFSARVELPEHTSYTHLRIAARNYENAEAALEPLCEALDASVSGERWALQLSGRTMARQLVFNARRLDATLLQELEAAEAAGKEVYITAWEAASD